MEFTDEEIHGYLKRCYRNATYSSDQKTQNGSVLIPTNGSFAFDGWNHFVVPEMVYPDDARKARIIVHAEQDAILAAARFGEATARATLFCVWAPCCQCAKAIIESGVTRLVTHKSMMDRTYPKYVEEVQAGLDMLKSRGIEHINWDGKIGDGVLNLMNGEVWHP